MTVKELLERLEYRIISGNTDSIASGICYDNRKVVEGDLFVCIRGAYFDTHDVIDQIAGKKPAAVIVDDDWVSAASEESIKALNCNIISVNDTRIAKAAVSAAWYGYPSEKMTVIGITGSKGKTTTSHMMWSMLTEAGFKAGMVGTTGGHIGEQSFHFGTTTPDSDKMQEFLSKMVDAGCEFAVVEASSQGLKLHRTDFIDFDYGIFLNIEKGDHISPNEHKDFDEYLDCKRRLLRSSKTCIVNGDDEHINDMLYGVSGNVIGYTMKGHQAYCSYDSDQSHGSSDSCKDGNRCLADYYVHNINAVDENGQPCIRFTLTESKDPEGREEYIVGMPGDFNAGNAAAACVCAYKCGVPVEAIKRALLNIKVPGRLDMVYRSDDLSVCVDYAHNGLSTRNLLKALRSYGTKRIVCVFGCGGNRDVVRRPEMGEAAGELADLSIITTEHNRFEEFDDILKGIMEGMNRTSGKYEIIEDRKEAIRHAIVDSEPGDLVAILGIGNDGFQHDHGHDIPHDDISYSRQMVDEWLRAKERM